MGIPRFYRALTKVLPNIEKILYTTTYKAPVVPKCDHFYLDANSIIHNAAQRIWGYGNYSRPMKDISGLNEDEINTMVYREVGSYIGVLLKIVNPKKTLHIMIDGVCPIAKQNQQMKRRARSAIERNGDQKFDSNCITPGTRFMEELVEYLNFYIRFRLTRKEWIVEVHLSDSNEPGEGEHKIAKWIRENKDVKNDDHCIYGLDADLIVISTTLPVKSIFLLRENVFVPITRMEFHVFLVEMFRQNVSEHLKHEKTDYISSLKDFSVITFILGNDFLPCVPYMNELSWSLPNLMKIYREEKLNLYKDGMINVEDMRKLAERMCIIQEEKLAEESLKEYKYPDETLKLCCKIRDSKSHGLVSEVDYDKWHRKMNVKFMKNMRNSRGKRAKTIEEAIKYYFDMINWNAEYYFKGLKDWKRSNTFNYGPTLHLLSKSIYGYEYKSRKTKATSVLSLLLCVTPEKSEMLIPEEIKDYRLKRENVEIVKEGTNIEWGGYVKIKPIKLSEVKRIEKVCNEMSKKTTRSIYIYNNTRGYKFVNKYGYVNNCVVKPLIT